MIFYVKTAPPLAKGHPPCHPALSQQPLSKSGDPVKSPLCRKLNPRNIIWLNLPFDKSVETKVGETFLKLAERHFNKNLRYYKMFNKNNLRFSNNCMKNMQTIIKQHHSQVTKKEEPCTRMCYCCNKF